jgi:hypothetical protein
MSILDIFAHIRRPSTSSAASALARRGAEKRSYESRHKKLEVARQIRVELGLTDDPRLA